MSTPRIALGGILTECNHLGGSPIDLDDFRRCELFRGDPIARIDTSVVGGMLQALREHHTNVVPLLYASSCPGGPLTSACYAELKHELLTRLRDAMPVDGVLMPLHGAATVDDVGDLEGDLLHAVRDTVGPDVPIVATLDLHAHVTHDMVRSADALVAWETYPHRDQLTTGRRSAGLLVDAVAGRCRPTMAMAKVPVITSAVHASTEGDDPFAQVMRLAKAHEHAGRALSTSVFLVQPYLDLPGMGSGGLVVTDNDRDSAVSLARQIADAYWARRFDLEPDVCTPQEAVTRSARVAQGPVLLVETADCCGGGAAGDSIATLAALIEHAAHRPSLVPVVDPPAAAACHQAGVGRQVTVALGHKVDPRWGESLVVTGRVTTLSDGRFTYVGGMWDGIEANMGPSAVLQVHAIRILVTTHPTYDWMDEQFRSVGLDPSDAAFIVAKNPMNYRQAYGHLAKATFILDTPGPTPATLRHVAFRHVKRPYFPADTDIPDLLPTILG